jgi:hypothetical protein
MTQVKVPIELKVKEVPTLNTAIAKELKNEDNKELFLSLLESAKGSGVC